MRVRAVVFPLLVSLGVAYPRLVRRPILTWGATSDEADGRPPGGAERLASTNGGAR